MNLFLFVMDSMSVESLFYICMLWSNIDFLQICKLNKGVLRKRLLRVSYVWYELDMAVLIFNMLEAVLFSFWKHILKRDIRLLEKYLYIFI